MKIAITGTRGLPNNYGGFETLAEYLVKYLAKDFEITVYCSAVDIKTRLSEYSGASLKYISITSHGFKGMIYDMLSIYQSVRICEKVIFLGPGGGFILPFLKKKHREKIILNFGGLDWKRNKWSPLARKIIKLSESLLVKYCKTVIADNKGILEYIDNEYNKKSILIAYGGDQSKKIAKTQKDFIEYEFLKNEYAFIVTRIQSDNNIELILDAFGSIQTLPLVIVGNWENSEYGRKIKLIYSKSKNLLLLDAIYDRDKLDLLRSNCKIYIHGHSAGGTNPSLVEAMFLGLPVFAFASGYNEHTTHFKAKYFTNANSLIGLIKLIDSIDLISIGNDLKKVADSNYRWIDIAGKYKEIILS